MLESNTTRVLYLGKDPAIAEMLYLLNLDGDSESLKLCLETRSNPGLSICKAGNTLTIAYSEPAYLFRALGLYAERATGEDFSLEQCPHFLGNGLMVDCSRNAVPTVQTVKTIIRQLALMGHNTLMLYTEDTYELEDEPYFGYMRGRYTIAELQELDAYAASFGIEMVPCIQTLAHLPAALRWSHFGWVHDIDDILLAESERTYALIEKMIRACRAAFRTKRIHIGMDEAEHLGRGVYRNLNGNKPSIDIMCQHLEKVTELCHRYDFSPMMWNDMFFTFAGGSYDPATGVDASLLEKAPADVAMVYWDYYTKNAETFCVNLEKQMRLPNELVFAGGAVKWYGYSPNLYYSLDASRLALSGCIKNGVKKVFTTAWGDNGGDASVFTILPIVQFYAEYGFDPDVTNETLARRFRTCTGGDWENFLSMSLPNMVDGKLAEANESPARYLLFNDPMTGLFDRHSCLAYEEHFAKAAKTIGAAAKQGGPYGHIFETIATLCSVLSLKAGIGLRLREAYMSDSREELRRLAEEVLPQIAASADALLMCVEKQWRMENKMFGFEVQDIRIAGVASRARSASRRVLSYLDGEVSRLEELEEERLYFDCREEDGPRKGTFCNIWTTMVSGSLI